MILDRYYYISFDEKAKGIYREIYAAIEAFSTSINIIKVEEDYVKRIIEGILLDNPHLFYFDLRGYAYCNYMTNTILSFSYLCKKSDMEVLKNRIEKRIRECLSNIDIEKFSDYEKEKYIHDYLCKNVQYDIRCAEGKNLDISSHTILGIFLDNKGVCDGISKAFKYLCNACGIKCIVAIGKAIDRQEENHAWNIVKIEGKAYHVDVTWDLNKYKSEGGTNYYFNLPDEMMYADHKSNYSYPKCENIIHNYFYQENKIFSNKKEFVEYIADSLLHRKTVIDYRLILRGTQKALDVIVNKCVEKAVQKAYISSVNAKMEMNYIQGCGRIFFSYGDIKRFVNVTKEDFNYDLLDGHGFEYFCADLLRYNGFEKIQVTSGSGDFGVDILCEFNSVLYAIQCKCYANTVGNKAVQEIYSGKAFYRCGKAVVITNNYFTAAAEETARLTDVELWDRGRLNELYRIAVNNGFRSKKY